MSVPTEGRPAGGRLALTDVRPGEGLRLSPGEFDAAVGPVPEHAEAAVFRRALLVHHGLEVEAEDPDGTVVRLSRRWALQAAVGTTVVGTVLGAAARPVYGLAVLLLLGAGCVVLAGGWARIAGRAPAWLPRGRALGFATLVPFAVVALAAVLLLREQHTRSLARDAAQGDLVRANAALDKGDVDAAITALAHAESVDPDARGLQITRSRLTIEQSSGKVRTLQARIRRLEARLAGAR